MYTANNSSKFSAARRNSTTSSSSAGSDQARAAPRFGNNNKSSPAAEREPAVDVSEVAPGRLDANFLHVLDPLIQGGKVPVPVQMTLHTKGRADWLAGKERRDLSVCCLFHKGRCFADKNCHQVHVDRRTLDEIREQHKHVVSCCRRCHDTASETRLAAEQLWEATGFSQLREVRFTEAGPVVPMDQVAYTTGLVDAFQAAHVAAGQTQLILQGSRLCRLHLLHNCKYGRDCKNFHICTSYAGQLLGQQAPQKTATTSNNNNHAVAAAKPSTVPVVSSTPKTSVSMASIRCAAPSQPLGVFSDRAVVAETKTQVPTAAAAAQSLPLPTLNALPSWGRVAAQPAPAFLRANYPVLDQGSLRSMAEPLPSAAEAALELSFRPFDRLVKFDDFDDHFHTSPSTASSSADSTPRRPQPTACVLDNEFLACALLVPSPQH